MPSTWEKSKSTPSWEIDLVLSCLQGVVCWHGNASPEVVFKPSKAGQCRCSCSCYHLGGESGDATPLKLALFLAEDLRTPEWSVVVFVVAEVRLVDVERVLLDKDGGPGKPADGDIALSAIDGFGAAFFARLSRMTHEGYHGVVLLGQFAERSEKGHDFVSPMHVHLAHVGGHRVDNDESGAVPFHRLLKNVKVREFKEALVFIGVHPACKRKDACIVPLRLSDTLRYGVGQAVLSR